MPISRADQGSLQCEHAGATTSAFILASWPAIAISTKWGASLVGWPEVRLGFCWHLRPTVAVSKACAGRNAVWSNLERRRTLFHQFPHLFQPPREAANATNCSVCSWTKQFIRHIPHVSPDTVIPGILQVVCSSRVETADIFLLTSTCGGQPRRNLDGWVRLHRTLICL